MNQENEQPRVSETALQTGVMRGIEQLDSLGAKPVAPDGPPSYKKEPLFSKKVMIGWATATLIVWFGVTVIIPEIVRSIKAEIGATIENTPPGATIVKTPNGKVTITRTETGVSFETRSGRRTIDLPQRPVAPVAPAPPAPEPVPPPDATGKK